MLKSVIEEAKILFLLAFFLTTILGGLWFLAAPILFPLFTKYVRTPLQHIGLLFVAHSVQMLILCSLLKISHSSKIREFVSTTREKYGTVIWLICGLTHLLALVMSKGNWYVSLHFSVSLAIAISVVRLTVKFEDSLAVAYSGIIQGLLAVVLLLSIRRFHEAVVAILPIIVAAHALVPCPNLKDSSKDRLSPCYPNY